MDEIDAKWAIYRRNLGQNSRWNIKLLLKFNFGRWITNWEQSGCWISLLPLKFNFGRRINTGVIWAVRSCWRGDRFFANNRQKIDNISPINRRLIGVIGNFSLKSPIYRVSTIYRRFFGNFLRKNGPPIYLNEMSCHLPRIHDISRHFPPCLILIVMHTFRTHPLKPAIKGRVPECL